MGSCQAASPAFRVHHHGSALEKTPLIHLYPNVPIEALILNKARVGEVMSGFSSSAFLLDSPTARPLALIATYWTLLVESCVALFFLIRGSKWASHCRNVALLQFLILTYPIATVIGFGWLLSIMGYAQCERSEGGYSLIYLGVFLVMQLFLIPWGAILMPTP
jgi:hypothetical protein